MKFRKTSLSFLICTFILSFTSNSFTQQLPPVIWNKPASGTEANVDYLPVTYSVKFSPDGQRVFSGGNRKYGSPEPARSELRAGGVVRVVYSAPRESADDVIERLLRTLDGSVTVLAESIEFIISAC